MCFSVFDQFATSCHDRISCAYRQGRKGKLDQRSSYPELYQTTLHHPSTTHIFTMGLSAELKTPVTGTYTQPTGLFINNEWVEGVDKKTFEVVNPSTEEVIVSVSEATEKDVDIAVAAARKAFNGVWRQTTPGQRSIYLLKLAELILKPAEKKQKFGRR
ncbi:Aldehyde dehydrogenase like protein [Verticillium longisporum]|nr:Aldehyde dehydrogenase like protein [Verticillium longisporum]